METTEKKSNMKNMLLEKVKDDESSSDEMEDENDTDDENQNVLIEQVQILEKELEKSPYMYDKHVELINLLRKVNFKSKLRVARKQMSSHFPLTEELWLEWLEDEKEDEDFALELLNKAVEDYQSVNLWIELALHQMKKSSLNSSPNNNVDNINNSNNNTELVRDIFERALSRVALHHTEAHLLWDAYQDFEMIVPCGDDGEDEKVKKVVGLLVRQLCCPLIGLNKTYNKYKEIVGEVDQVVEGHYQRSTTLLNKILSFEKTLKEDQSVDIYNNYIQHLINNNLDPNLVVCVYERAVKVHCLQPSLWSSYLDYMYKHLHIETVLTPVCRRAVRNCPWSVFLWIKYLTTLEAFNTSHDIIKATFTEAQSVGLSQPHEHLSLWTAYLDYLRRRLSANTIDNKSEAVELRETFDNANKQLTQAFSQAGDPTCSLLQYQAFIEAKHLGEMERCRELYDMALKSSVSKLHQPWLQYAQLERTHGGVKGARKVYQRALNSVAQETVEWVVEEYVRFEREEGDLENYEKALEKCETQMKRIADRRAKDKEKESKYKGRQQQKETKKEGTKQKNKNILSNKKSNNHTSHSKHHPVHPVHHKTPNHHDDDDGGGEVVTKPYQKTRPMLFDRSDSENNKVPTTVFKVPLPPPPGFAEHHNNKMKMKMMKRSKPENYNDDEDEGGGNVNPIKKPKSAHESSNCSNEEFIKGLTSTTLSTTTPATTTPATTTPATTTPATTTSQSDLCTVFVSNLDYAVTKEDISETLKKAGSLKEVRLVTNNKGQSKGYAYVTFLQQSSATKALEMDRLSLQGRPMFISKLKKTGRSDVTDNPFKFGDRLETNKLFVKNIATCVTQQQLQTLFQTTGEVKEVRIATYRNGRSKGHAYIEFVKEEEAAAAVIKLDGHMLQQQPISVAISNPPARNQRMQDAVLPANHVASLGGGKKDMGRKSQLSMLPRKLQMTPSTSSAMNNQDFRNMLLQKK